MTTIAAILLVLALGCYWPIQHDLRENEGEHLREWVYICGSLLVGSGTCAVLGSSL